METMAFITLMHARMRLSRAVRAVTCETRNTAYRPQYSVEMINMVQSIANTMIFVFLKVFRFLWCVSVFIHW